MTNYEPMNFASALFWLRGLVKKPGRMTYTAEAVEIMLNELDGFMAAMNSDDLVKIAADKLSYDPSPTNWNRARAILSEALWRTLPDYVRDPVNENHAAIAEWFDEQVVPLMLRVAVGGVSQVLVDGRSLNTRRGR